MKLRIRGNSVRIRVTKSELERVAAEGGVGDAVNFGAGSRLCYRLEATDAEDVAVLFAGDTLAVHVPRTLVAQWAGSDQVSIIGEQVVGSGETLRILVEKDFECLSPRADEPPGDFFENPARARD